MVYLQGPSEQAAIVWDPSLIHQRSETAVYWDDDMLQPWVKRHASQPSLKFLSYHACQEIHCCIVNIVRRTLEDLLQKVGDDCAMERSQSEIHPLSVPVAVAIPEGILLPIAIEAVCCLNEPFFIGNRSCSVVLVPLEPTEGRERLRDMIWDCRPALILTTSVCDTDRLNNIVSTDCRPNASVADESIATLSHPALYRAKSIQFLNLQQHILDSVGDGNEKAHAASTDLPSERVTESLDRISHIVYTSGSTGAPKGCVSSIQALRSYLSSKNTVHNVLTSSTVLLASTISFDPCFSDILATFQIGATLAIAPRRTLRESLTHVLYSLQISHVLCTPTLWSTLALTGTRPADLFPSLRMVALGGEPIPLAIVQAWARASPDDPVHCRLLATYGVTEACVYQSAGEVFRLDCGQSKGQDVGLMLPGMRVSICDESIQESLTEVLPADIAVGEVVLSGSQLDSVCSYLNRPALSISKYLKSERHWHYRTGDRGYIDSKTLRLHITGRINGEDGMVKINGIRIELGEIENALVGSTAALATVLDAMVVPHVHCITATDLVAYVVLGGDCRQEMGVKGTISSDGVLLPPCPLMVLLRHRCKLKARMIPAFFIIVPRTPLSPTGKRHRAGLPPLEAAVPFFSILRQGGDAISPVPLGTYGKSGSMVASHIVDCLNLQYNQQALLTTDASFAMLGGDSLAATRVVRALYAAHHCVHNSRHLGGEYGVMEGPFDAVYLIGADNLGSYVDWLDQNKVCQSPNVVTKPSCDDPVRDAMPTSSNISPPTVLEQEESQLYDALFQSVTQGQVAIAMALLSVGADPNQGGHDGRLGKISSRNDQKIIFRSSPLHLACVKGIPLLVEALLAEGARMNSPDASGLFPLHLAAAGEARREQEGEGRTADDCRRLECVKLLIAAGTPLSMKDGSKQTVIHCAARGGHVATLSYVLKEWHRLYGTDPEKCHGVNWRDRWLRTPVHWAVLNGHVDALVVLLQHGCDSNPPQPKMNKRSSAAIESPLQTCERLYGSTPLGERIRELLLAGKRGICGGDNADCE